MNYKEWTEKVRDEQPKLGIKTYRQTDLERFLSKTVPYCKFIPLTKRQRVKLRAKYRYAYKRRFMDDMTSVLREAMETNVNKYIETDFFWNDVDDFTWEVVTNKD